MCGKMWKGRGRGVSGVWLGAAGMWKGCGRGAVGPKKRRKYESLAAMYLQDHEYVDMAVRFDVVGLLVIKPDRALLRHHINAFGVA